jgi:hypothetical protein
LVQNAALPSIEIVQGPTYITATNRGGLGWFLATKLVISF